MQFPEWPVALYSLQYGILLLMKKAYKSVYINNTCSYDRRVARPRAMSEVVQCALPLRRPVSDRQESRNADDYCRISMCPFALEFNTGVAMLCKTPEFLQSNGLSYIATYAGTH